jgi:hypothetical protein
VSRRFWPTWRRSSTPSIWSEVPDRETEMVRVVRAGCTLA